jgi:hypothetical protein
MQKITDEELAAVRAKNTRGVVVLNVVNDDGAVVGQFAFKKIGRVEYAQFRSATKQGSMRGGGTGEEEQQLARSLLVWPEDKAAFDALREDAPAVVTGFGQELLSDADAGFSVTRDPR